jgi:hypothetical protein
VWSLSSVLTAWSIWWWSSGRRPPRRQNRHARIWSYVCIIHFPFPVFEFHFDSNWPVLSPWTSLIHFFPLFSLSFPLNFLSPPFRVLLRPYRLHVHSNLCLLARAYHLLLIYSVFEYMLLSWES